MQQQPYCARAANQYRGDFEGPDAPGSGGKTGKILQSKRTDYKEFCYAEQVGWTADGQTHMVAFEAIEDGSPSNVHHIVMYGYAGAGCDGMETVVWVGGIGFYEDLPSNVGMSLARVRSFRLQIHYDNPSLVPGLRDNSGVRVWTSSVAPAHEAGTLQLGDPTLNMAEESSEFYEKIPVGRSFFTFTCDGATTASFPHDITVFGSILHMHQKVSPPPTLLSLVARAACRRRPQQRC